jgi:5-methylcytosine-specific restriction endonuclease McrA
MESSTYCLERLGDQDLMRGFHESARKSNEAAALFLAFIAEVDHRKLYLVQGPSPSMHAYLVERLNLGEYEAYDKLRAARAARQFPLIFERVAEGAIHVTGVRLLAPCLTAENHPALLDAARGRSAEAIKELVAAQLPREDVSFSLRRVPGTPARFETSPASLAETGAPALASVPGGSSLPPAPSQRGTATPPSAAGVPATPSRVFIEPTAQDRFSFRFSASRSFRDKFQEAKDLLAHAVPDGNPEEILGRALDLLLLDVKRRRFALGTRAKETDRQARRTGEPARTSRHIPNEVRRAVTERDGLRCTFAGADGARCNETARLELHHRDNFSRGGAHSVENVAVLCRGHNAALAERDFGEAAIARKIEEARAAGAARIRV